MKAEPRLSRAKEGTGGEEAWVKVDASSRSADATVKRGRGEWEWDIQLKKGFIFIDGRFEGC